MCWLAGAIDCIEVILTGKMFSPGIVALKDGFFVL